MITARSITEIQDFLKWHQKRLALGDAIPNMGEVAERAEFGQAVQIMLICTEN